jgi:hypothetical protein
MPKDKGTVASDNSNPVIMMKKGKHYKRRLEKNTNLNMRRKKTEEDGRHQCGGTTET